MPTIDYICRECEHTFCRITLEGEDHGRHTCPRCKSTDLKASVQPTKLFKGIANDSSLAKDTN